MMIRPKNSVTIIRILAIVELLLFVQQFSQTNAQAAISETERNALIALYNSTNGAAWKQNTGWLEDPGTECSWYGVTCDQNGNVTNIDLYNNQLSGSIPAELGNLMNLQISGS